MISFPLFKQSVKANWVTWLLVTIVSCFILAVLICILGTLNINEIRNSLKDMFKGAETKSELQYETIDSYQGSYDVYTTSLSKYKEMMTVVNGAVNGSIEEKEYADFSVDFKSAINQIRNAEAQILSNENKLVNAQKELSTSKITYSDKAKEAEEQINLLNGSKAQLQAGIESAQAEKEALETSLSQVNNSILQINAIYDTSDEQTRLQLDARLNELNANKAQIETGISTYQAGIDEANGKIAQIDAGIKQINDKLLNGKEQITSAENKINDARQTINSAKSTLSSKKNEFIKSADETIIEEIEKAVYEEAMEEKNDAGKAEASKKLVREIINKYKNKEDVSAEAITEMAKNYVISAIYEEAVKENSEDDATEAKKIATAAIGSYRYEVDAGIAKEEAIEDVSKSVSEELPSDVADALEELGDMDVYGLVVGSISYRIAGLLLPMVYIIMTCNSLIAGQVDSGSMAYVLSTPIKRKKVARTQMMYMVLSLLAMYILLTITSLICTYIVTRGASEFDISYTHMILFNVGAFCTMFAVSGICFLCSAWYNRSKTAISVGGGITMLSLVCTIMGLFGSKVVPSIIRISAMDYFNYASIISLFDTVSILNGTTDFIWKLAILIVLGLILYSIGIVKFDKKDLPL